MADESAIKILGLARFRSTLRKAGLDMADMKDANQEAARIVQREASAIAPHRSGDLSGSLRTPRTASKAVVRSNLIYAPVIHWGWPHRNIKGQPFLTDASARTSHEWMETYAAAMQRIANSVQGA
jgi:phage gpG-like protein